MRSIILNNGQYCLTDSPRPEPEPHEVLIKVAYAGINRADLLQKQGQYPLPGGEYAIPGMEVSGEIIQCGSKVKNVAIGDRVCALLTQGGYAEYVCAPATLLLPIPAIMPMQEAASLPEACFTVWISLVWQAKLQPGETILIHGGASGIGTMAIQIATHLGAQVFATAGSPEKCALCIRLGASKAIDYRAEDYVQVIKTVTGDKGVDVILDMVGGDYVERNLACLARGGRLAIIAFLRGSKVAVNLGPVLLKHLSITGSTLRSRPLQEKAQIAQELRETLWKSITEGRIKPVIDQIFMLKDAEKALARMDQGLNVGKIVLKV